MRKIAPTNPEPLKQTFRLWCITREGMKSREEFERETGFNFDEFTEKHWHKGLKEEYFCFIAELRGRWF